MASSSGSGSRPHSLDLSEIENGSTKSIEATVWGKTVTLDPNTSLTRQSYVDDIDIDIVHDDFNFKIIRTGNELTVTESTHDCSVKLEITGGNGEFNVRVPNRYALIIEDVSAVKVLKYEGASADYYHFLSAPNKMGVALGR